MQQSISMGRATHHLGQGCREVACSSASKGCSCSCSRRSWGSSHSGLLAANFATGWSPDIEEAGQRCCCCCYCCCYFYCYCYCYCCYCFCDCSMPANTVRCCWCNQNSTLPSIRLRSVQVCRETRSSVGSVTECELQRWLCSLVRSLAIAD
jgi:hypothetical protein